ncbi:hypothetical protein RNJ44_03130 [Nakaseomyces bracarensis]|uniref:WD repeat protein mio zinc-ribbon like domain-containing protein n=1 Tax=Nakaseomyces bracarensis TaxID=273131 RepID=A0ABR4NYU5_9SACH
MALIKKVFHWSYDQLLDYLSVNPTRDEVTHYKVDPNIEGDDSIMKMRTIKDFGSITCLDYSESELGVVAVGEKDGFMRLFNIISSDDSSEDLFNINARAKQQRSINAVGINNNGLIAIGLDRHRHDPSLQIWDMNYQSTESEIINPTFAYCTNESIVSLKFLNDTNILTSSTKFLKEIDVRSPNSIYQHPTRLTYDIKLNPFNDWQFSTYGDDGTLAIWDRRKLESNVSNGNLTLTTPLLTFEKLVGAGSASRKYMNSCFRWSPIRNKEFATLYRGDTVKIWRLGSYLEEDSSFGDYENLFVSTVHDVETPYDRVATFDYISRSDNMTSLLCMRQSGTVYRMSIEQTYTNSSFSNKNSLLLSNSDSPDFDEITISQEKPKSKLENLGTTHANISFEDLDLRDDYNNSESHSDGGYEDADGYSVNTSHTEELDNAKHSLHEGEGEKLYWKAEKLLQEDISVIMRKRASLGYGLEPMSTVEIIDGSKALQNYSYIRNTWRWIAIAKASADDGTMVSGDLDLGYEGIIGIWNGMSGIANQNRHREDVILTEKQLIREMEKIITMRRKSKDANSYHGSIAKFSDSPKFIQRRLCLIISGWDLSPSDYESKYNIIIKNGNHEKAAAWAMFFGDIPKAIEILGSSKKERLRLIATAISGYMAYKDQPGNNAWRQQCRKMSNDLDDPYLRVIFSYIADNEWWDVLYEPAISLRERLGVALRFLNDADLTRFLERTSDTVISNGELEGLILTGITPSGIDLLQSYVSKTSDIQSAALISIYGCPRYFKDQRVDEWIETYRTMLNSWMMFNMRAKFDVLRAKLSRTSNGDITSEITPRQLYIQCLNCKKNINKPNEDSDPRKSLMNKMKRKTAEQENKVHHSYSCPHCGAPFPRCAICLMPLGTSNLPFIINGLRTEEEEEFNESEKSPDLEQDSELKLSLTNDSRTFSSGETNVFKRKLKLNEWFSFCLTCKHGMHAGHADEWFEKHTICPTPGCICQCNR